jgi:hypothetical protein
VHPDTLAASSASLSSTDERDAYYFDTTDLCTLLNEVYETLSDPEQRATYDALVGFSAESINPFTDGAFERDQVRRRGAAMPSVCGASNRAVGALPESMTPLHWGRQAPCVPAKRGAFGAAGCRAAALRQGSSARGLPLTTPPPSPLSLPHPARFSWMRSAA